MYTGEHSFSSKLEDKSKVIQYRAIETISCSFILFYFVIFDPFPPFFLGPEGGPQKGGPRFVYTRFDHRFSNTVYQRRVKLSCISQFYG